MRQKTTPNIQTVRFLLNKNVIIALKNGDTIPNVLLTNLNKNSTKKYFITYQTKNKSHTLFLKEIKTITKIENGENINDTYRH